MNPENILLIKSHSMGIGDLLRSSAAWQALKKRWPNSRLYLLMLSKHPGYPTEQLIREHHLLDDAFFVSVADGPDAKQKRPRAEVYNAVAKALGGVRPDLIIDCEPHGMRTTFLTRWLAKRCSANTVGVAQFPMRGWLYDHAAPSTRCYARGHSLRLPMDYAERDFVALAALGIARNGTPIVLSVSKEGREWQKEHLPNPPGDLRVTLNIGCGTIDALPKRPAMDQLVANMAALFLEMPFELHVSGADFEREVNAQFVKGFADRLSELGMQCTVTDWAGQCTLSQLTGLLGASDLVISTDSGPYHMAVALGVPTVCWFNFDTPPSYHHQAKVRAVIAPSPELLVAAAKEVLGLT
jgi:ADP-heptose:LPS heptosyltransferase